jgi:hypothetical protein
MGRRLCGRPLRGSRRLPALGGEHAHQTFGAPRPPGRGLARQIFGGLARHICWWAALWRVVPAKPAGSWWARPVRFLAGRQEMVGAEAQEFGP